MRMSANFRDPDPERRSPHMLLRIPQPSFASVLMSQPREQTRQEAQEVESASPSALRCSYLCRLPCSGEQRQRLLLRSKKKEPLHSMGLVPRTCPLGVGAPGGRVRSTTFRACSMVVPQGASAGQFTGHDAATKDSPLLLSRRPISGNAAELRQEPSSTRQRSFRHTTMPRCGHGNTAGGTGARSRLLRDVANTRTARNKQSLTTIPHRYREGPHLQSVAGRVAALESGSDIPAVTHQVRCGSVPPSGQASGPARADTTSLIVFCCFVAEPHVELPASHAHSPSRSPVKDLTDTRGR